MSEMPSLPSEKENLGRTPIPRSLLEERREMSVSLRNAGLSVHSSLKEINRLDSSKHWGIITLRTLERDIANYYGENKALTQEERECSEGRRKSHLAQMENTLEEMALHIAKKNKDNNWKPFEKAAALEKLHKMQMGLADLQGWNLSKTNTIFSINNIGNANIQNNNLEIYDRGIENIRTAPSETQQRITDIFRGLREESEKHGGL